MQNNKLVEQVQKLNDTIRGQIESINNGGCGIFAYYVVKELRAKGFDAKIIILDGSFWETEKERKESFQNKKNFLNDIENTYKHLISKRELSFNHCYITVEGQNFDGLQNNSKLLSNWETHTIVGEYTLAEMKIALKEGGWNDMYDRRQSALLKNIVKRMFKDVEPIPAELNLVKI